MFKNTSTPSDGNTARHRSRESKRIPFIERICVLEDAVSADFAEPQEHYVAYPIKPGAQPCLTVVTRHGRSQTLASSVVILPENAPHGPPQTNAVYQSCLGLIQRAHTPLIRRLNRHKGKIDPITELIGSWTNSEWSNPPFRSKTLDQLLIELKIIVKNTGPDRLPKDARASVSKAIRRASRRWIPLHLAIGALEKDRKHQWWILSQWPAWEAARLQPYERLVEYRKEFPESGPRPEQPDYRIFRRIMGSFQKIYQEYLRLKCNTRNETRTMKTLHRDWRVARSLI